MVYDEKRYKVSLLASENVGKKTLTDNFLRKTFNEGEKYEK